MSKRTKPNPPKRQALTQFDAWCAQSFAMQTNCIVFHPSEKAPCRPVYAAPRIAAASQACKALVFLVTDEQFANVQDLVDEGVRVRVEVSL